MVARDERDALVVGEQPLEARQCATGEVAARVEVGDGGLGLVREVGKDELRGAALDGSIEELQAQEAALEQEFSARFRRAVAAERGL